MRKRIAACIMVAVMLLSMAVTAMAYTNIANPAQNGGKVGSNVRYSVNEFGYEMYEGDTGYFVVRATWSLETVPDAMVFRLHGYQLPMIDAVYSVRFSSAYDGLYEPVVYMNNYNWFEVVYFAETNTTVITFAPQSAAAGGFAQAYQSAYQADIIEITLWSGAENDMTLSGNAYMYQNGYITLNEFASDSETPDIPDVPDVPDDPGYTDEDLQEAYQYGYDNGYMVGTSDGFESGRSFGYQEGYQKGKADGIVIGKNEQLESGLGSGIGDFLTTTIGGFFRFELMPGLSIGGIFTAVVGCLALVWFLKMLAGG